ncbi:MAG: hypothetical protein ACR2KX_16525 [Chitinophagaceae bacterium]
MKKTRFNLLCITGLLMLFYIGCKNKNSEVKNSTEPTANNNSEEKVFDTATYNKSLQHLANGDTTGRWPVKTPYPLSGAIFPYNRIVAFYGNLYSTRMGILGEIPKDSMFKKLLQEVEKWKAADTMLPVLPALHYIAVTAQGSPGKGAKYRLRMPFHQIDTIINWAKEINALVFVDIQVGHSTIKDEIGELEKYLKMPQVHFGIDPEFSLKNGEVPGTSIGSFSAEDVNSAIDFLADIVRKNNLPPKILVIHRFTQGMVTDYEKIKKVPEVQVVIDMDGWGDKILKRSTWLRYIYNEPIQFAGFKLFYKNDTKKGKDQLYTPEELSRFVPKPIYIQYQ